jgi:hypothetical protein
MSDSVAQRTLMAEGIYLPFLSRAGKKAARVVAAIMLMPGYACRVTRLFPAFALGQYQ